jgi:Ca2+-binding EF-hand superfamily protein
MKSSVVLIVATIWGASSCRGVTDKPSEELAGLSDDEAYLLDSVESTADDSAVASTTTTSAVAEDLPSEKLVERATRLLAVADVDASGALNLEEFVSGPEKMRAQFGRRDRPDPSPEKLEKMKSRLTEAFGKHAGNDALMSKDEIVQFLAQSAPRVSHRRDHGDGHKQHRKPNGKHKRGQHEGGRSEHSAWERVAKEFDKDGDGRLNQTEFEALLAARRAR